MANISSQIPLDAFVRRLLGKEEKTNDDYLRYMQIACEGLREFHIQQYDVEVTKVVTVNTTTNTFAYPSDYVRYVMIGTPIDGRWWYYTRAQNMVPLEDDDGVTIQDDLPNISDFEFPKDLSSGGGNNRYYFREDQKNQRFQVGGHTPDIVVLKYVSNGLDSSGDINIPDYSLLALEAYVRWTLADYDEAAASTIIRLERQYKDRVRSMRRAQRPTLQDIVDTINSTSSQLLRRG
jgi:hypothetical protein